MGFSRQKYWSDLPFPPPGDLPDPGIEPKSHALACGFFTTEPFGGGTPQIHLQGKQPPLSICKLLALTRNLPTAACICVYTLVQAERIPDYYLKGRNQIDFYHFTLKVFHPLIFAWVPLRTRCGLAIKEGEACLTGCGCEGFWLVGVEQGGAEELFILKRPGRRPGKVRGHLDPCRWPWPLGGPFFGLPYLLRMSWEEPCRKLHSNWHPLFIFAPLITLSTCSGLFLEVSHPPH